MISEDQIILRRYLNQAVIDKKLCRQVQCDAHACYCTIGKQPKNTQGWLPCAVGVYTEFMEMLLGRQA